NTATSPPAAPAPRPPGADPAPRPRKDSDSAFDSSCRPAVSLPNPLLPASRRRRALAATQVARASTRMPPPPAPAQKRRAESRASYRPSPETRLPGLRLDLPRLVIVRHDPVPAVLLDDPVFERLIPPGDHLALVIN